MIKYTEQLKEPLRNVSNVYADFGISYDVMWAILDDRPVRMKTILQLMEILNLTLEEAIQYEKD